MENVYVQYIRSDGSLGPMVILTITKNATVQQVKLKAEKFNVINLIAADKTTPLRSNESAPLCVYASA